MENRKNIDVSPKNVFIVTSNRVLILLVILASVISACNSEETEICQNRVDSLKAEIIGCNAKIQEKNELIVSFNSKLNEFGNVHDSIKARELKIEQLKETIKRRGYAVDNENEMLSSMFTQIDSFLVKNEELALQFNSVDYKNANQKQIVKLLMTNLEDKQNQINNLKKSVVELEKQVKNLKLGNAILKIKNKKIIEKANKIIISDYIIELPKNILKNDKKAKKIDNINICFALNKSEFVSAGSKTVYIRIIEPNGHLLDPSDDKLFNYNGNETGYTMKTEIEYNPNEKETICKNWRRTNKKLMSGKYEATLFIDGYELETKFFKLR